jgi:tRNA(Arg) A34 adenosine deaminase TadA
MSYPSAVIALPGWVAPFVEQHTFDFTQAEQRMAFVAALAIKNVEAGTGGPFGAAVFSIRSAQLIAPGVNLVMSANLSSAHAEVVALSIAQQVLQTFDLNAADADGFELVTSCEPCAMCLGAIPWSGVRRVLCGATESDAAAVGFHEGVKPQPWQSALSSRGIAVETEVGRANANKAFTRYKELDGKIYNAC